MEIVTNPKEVYAITKNWQKQGLRTGLVPTMGCLHDGHASLIRKALEENHRVVVSLFVNPLQFAPSEDLDRYPRVFNHDTALCKKMGVHVLFHPGVNNMYPEGFCTSVSVDTLTTGLCGASRPGHFTGVCTVVCKLLILANADSAYFGQKDAQQLALVRRMVRDLDIPVSIVGCPTIREEDGLAKSSRNVYLTPEERTAALALFRGLKRAEEAVFAGERDKTVLETLARAELEKEPLLRVDYVALVDPLTLEPLRTLRPQGLLAVAAYVGKTRLIDNLPLVL